MRTIFAPAASISTIRRVWKLSGTQISQRRPATDVAKASAALYDSCDALLVAGSRLRGNETLKYRLALPTPRYRLDADPQANAGYAFDECVLGDAGLGLHALADRLQDKLQVDPEFGADIATAHADAERQLRDTLGPYTALVDCLQASVGREFIWVRDVTISNSTWGNRSLRSRCSQG